MNEHVRQRIESLEYQVENLQEFKIDILKILAEMNNNLFKNYKEINSNLEDISYKYHIYDEEE